MVPSIVPHLTSCMIAASVNTKLDAFRWAACFWKPESSPVILLHANFCRRCLKKWPKMLMVFEAIISQVTQIVVKVLYSNSNVKSWKVDLEYPWIPFKNTFSSHALSCISDWTMLGSAKRKSTGKHASLLCTWRHWSLSKAVTSWERLKVDWWPLYCSICLVPLEHGKQTPNHYKSVKGFFSCHKGCGWSSSPPLRWQVAIYRTDSAKLRT